MNQALTTTEKPPQVQHSEFSAFGSITHFEHAQRMAKALSSSSMVPEIYRGDQNLGSCMIALEIANRIGMNVLAVMQNLFPIHGKPAWSSQFLIACINASGKFSPMRYRMTGEKEKDSFGCVAWATDTTGQTLESPEITVGMAKAEGWYQKNGSKWKTMPELMLRYRAAAFFARLYAPGITMGILSENEVLDIVEVPVVAPTTAPQFGPTEMVKAPKKGKKQEPIDVTPAVEAAPEPVKEPAVPAPEPDTESFEQIVDGAPALNPEPLNQLRKMMALADVDDRRVVAFYNTNKGKDALAVTRLEELKPETVEKFTNILGNKDSAMAKKIREL